MTFQGRLAAARLQVGRLRVAGARLGTGRPWVAAALAGIIAAAAGCAAPGPTPTPTPSPTPRQSATMSPAASATPRSTGQPSAPPGTELIDVPEAGVLIPVPATWVRVPAADLQDAGKRAEIAARYPGADALLSQTDRLDGQATPVLLAVDPTAAERSEPLAANLSVLVTQPSIGGPLLDLVAGFIADGMVDGIGATGTPTKEHLALAAGDAVRIGLDVPPRDGIPMSATAWVIGAPRGTMLVTLLGPAAVLAGFDPDALVAAIIPDASGSQ